MRYFIPNEGKSACEEVSEAEYNAIVGDEKHLMYASNVRGGVISLDDVPESFLAKVAEINASFRARYGENLSAEETLKIILGGEPT